MSTHDESTGPEGYDVPAVERWILDNGVDLQLPLKWTRLQGGHSNLTYRIEDAAGRVAVIRRPPQGVLLPKAHDMSREWALISALGPTPVPVPEAIAFCEDPEVTGAWFYIMGHVDGRPLYSREETEEWVPLERRRTHAFSFIDVLAALHDVDPDEVGLGDLGKRDSYVGRQLKTWYRSWMASIEGADLDHPLAHEIHDYLLANLPEQEPARVVHGDYGVHNTLTGADSTIVAVVDWEISTLGDPLADLAYALNVWPDSEEEWALKPDAATSVPGFPWRSELAARYGERTGRDLSHLDYYLAFNHWKSAAIVHGVYARYCEGKKSSDDVDLDEMRDRILRTLNTAEASLNKVRG